MKKICVYLGSSAGNIPGFESLVRELAMAIVSHGYGLVYGGSSLGMMGVLANTIKINGGYAIGVITDHLFDIERPLKTLDELHLVRTMQERKKRMQTVADGFLVLPGGLGTLEEALESWNGIKIGEINKKIGFLNINGYFDNLFKFMNDCVDNGFLDENSRSIPIMHTDVKTLLNKIMQF